MKDAGARRARAAYSGNAITNVPTPHQRGQDSPVPQFRHGASRRHDGDAVLAGEVTLAG